MDKLITLLADGKIHSGEELGRALGVTRAGIWKAMARLESDLGLSLDRVRGKGYRLSTRLNLLKRELLTETMMALGWEFILVSSLPSTNGLALARFREAGSAPFLILAEHQTAGRGRRGRHWASPLGENLYLSFGFVTHDGARCLSGLSLVTGLAVLAALQDHGLSGAGLKWPNDVMVEDRKIAGILIELAGDPAGTCQVVVGVGVNVNMVVADIDQPWTSLRLELGRMVDRSSLAVALSKRLAEALERHRLRGFEAFRSQWEANHLWQGKLASLRSGSSNVHGLVVGVDDSGALLMEVDGVRQAFNGGELSLRLV